MEWLPVGNFPAVQRDSYLSRLMRRDDTPLFADSVRVEWADMRISFSAAEPVAEATIEVLSSISLVTFTQRVERLLDLGAKSDGTEWIIKFSCRMSDYGSPEEVRRLLCDQIAQLDGQTGETVGVLKIKRRSVDAGHAKVRLVPAEDLLQVVVRHLTAQGLKAVWKSVLWRLRPQYGAPKAADSSAGAEPADSFSSARPGASNGAPKATITQTPCVQVQCESYHWTSYAGVVSSLGGEIDITQAQKDGLDVKFSLDANSLNGFGELERDYNGKYRWREANCSAKYFFQVRLLKIPAGGIPAGISIGSTGFITVTDTRYSAFRQTVLDLVAWLGLRVELPPVPATSNEIPPTEPPKR